MTAFVDFDYLNFKSANYHTNKLKFPVS